MTPERIEFVIGQTTCGQTIRLVYEHSERSWTIHKDELNQRDQPDTIRGIPGDVIERMAEAVKTAPR